MMIVFISCSGNKDCFFADRVEKIKALNFQEKDHYVYARVSGHQEKVVIYELYDDPPKFDECGKSNIRPVAADVVDDSRGRAYKLIIENLKIQVLYSNDSTKIVDFKKIPVEIR